MTELLGVVKHTSIEEGEKQFYAYVTLPMAYDENLNVATQLKNVFENEEEIDNYGQWCVMAFLLYIH